VSGSPQANLREVERVYHFFSFVCAQVATTNQQPNNQPTTNHQPTTNQPPTKKKKKCNL